MLKMVNIRVIHHEELVFSSKRGTLIQIWYSLDTVSSPPTESIGNNRQPKTEICNSPASPIGFFPWHMRQAIISEEERSGRSTSAVHQSHRFINWLDQNRWKHRLRKLQQWQLLQQLPSTAGPRPLQRPGVPRHLSSRRGTSRQHT